jgi:molybdopterin molybdotransferase
MSADMLELEEARERIYSRIAPLTTEEVLVNEGAGKGVGAEVFSSLDLPRYDNSAMDGYAVRARELVGASKGSPVTMELQGRLAAGEVFSEELKPACCVRVFTGSVLPEGADAVVMQEDVELDANDPGRVRFFDAAKPWENVRFRGEDIKTGGKLVGPGERLTAARIGLLAAAGISRMRVVRQPVVGLLATGSELREPGEALGPGQIYESNRAALGALLKQAGAVPRIYPVVKDDLGATRASLEKAFAETDLVVSSGGVSVGELDFVKAAFEEIGGELGFWKIAMKPGKPFVFGSCGGKLFFGLPGNPVSAFVTCVLLVCPAVQRMQGMDGAWPVVRGILAVPMGNPGDRRHYIRVRMDSSGLVHSAGTQASHMMHSLANANGLVEVPPEGRYAAGEMVKVLKLED